MIAISWIKGMITHRGGRLFGAIIGIAVTVALLSSIGIFISYSGATMTERAIADIPVDWQVQLAQGSDINTVQNAIDSVTHYTSIERVGYADTSGFIAQTAGTTQTTGPGKVLGISDNYFNIFPGEIRQLIGSTKGVLVAQQTAANLHVQVGDTVTIQRVGLSPVQVKVDGIVDLPNADSLFQAIGLPAGAAPQAPPDNVLLLPMVQWHQIFDQQAVVRPDSVHTQLHVKVDHNFPADPKAAYEYVLHESNNLEARIAGSAVVGNNLAARLSAVREDAFYAKVLFFFLGLPGTVLAILLTLFIITSGAKHRRKEQSYLNMHGASMRQILKFEALEGWIVGIGGIILGSILTYFIFKTIIPENTVSSMLFFDWLLIASVLGLIIAMTAILFPAWKRIKYSTIASEKPVGQRSIPIWQRYYFDIFILIISGIEFWRTASTGYQVVLAPEGVTAISVNYEAFIGPFCLWIGGVLLAMRFCELLLNNGQSLLAKIIRPIAKNLSKLAASSISREGIFLKRGIILVALAVSFAVSTSIFNSTYNAQAHVDAELTNGSDVTVTGLVPFEKNDNRNTKLKSLPDIAGMQFMQHRFAYVGNDLQDIYGIDPLHITEATNISNAYFDNGDVKATLSELAQHPDGILVSEETVKDFQLQPGDQLNLRIQNAIDHQYYIIPFHFVGIVREFPTAPKDSFLVANMDYISQMTGSRAYELLLIRSKGSPDELARQIKNAIGSLNVKISDIGSTQRVIDSSLTSVDLKGLTKLELIFALMLVAGAVGLILALGLSERRRKFAILMALGAKENQLSAFIWSEALIMIITGSMIGIILGLGVAQMLVKVLTGVFDPPPQFLTIPWGYLALLTASGGLSVIAAVYIIKAISRRPAVEELRKL